MFNQFQFNQGQFNSSLPTTPLPVRFAIAKQSLIPYVRRYLNAPNTNQIWTDAFLYQLIQQAETWIMDACNTVWIRFPLAIQLGIATYQMPFTVKYITRMTYRGFKMWVVTQKELALLSPVYRTQQTRPRWASWQFDGFSSLRLYPVPSENLPILSTGNQIYTDINLLNECVISAYVFPNEANVNFSLPDYFIRRIVKSYVLWKAYAAEGLPQDLDVAQYFKKKFEGHVQSIIEAHTRVYANKNRQLADVAIQRPWRKYRPILPPNFGTPVDMY